MIKNNKFKNNQMIIKIRNISIHFRIVKSYLDVQCLIYKVH